MSILLPPTIALKSSECHHYLNYCNNSESAKVGFLRFNGANAFSPLAKFEVVAAKIGTGVHIRCFHNKKFLRRRSELVGNISPEADEPEEDQSKWTCTLFEPQADVNVNPDKIRLLHLYKKQYARVQSTLGDKDYYPVLDNSGCDWYMYDIIDLESLMILPKHVAFKSCDNRYLQHVDNDELRFTSTDKGIPQSWFEMCTDGEGKVKIKVFNSLKDNYLRLHSGYQGNRIFADGGSTDTTHPSEFWPVKINDRTVALKCLSNDKFCTRYGEDCLHANDGTTSICESARLRLEELVLSRRIYNTELDLRNAIIYGETPVTMATAKASNNTSVPNTVVFKFTYKDTKSSTWDSSYSWMVGGSVSASFKVPLIGTGGKLTVSASYTRSYQWAGTVTSEKIVETTYTVTVPAYTSVYVNLMATKGCCDVPYSYYQRDVLYNGETVIYKKDDGLYKGVNSYNFRYEVTTLKEPHSDSDSKADLPTPDQRFPVPSMFPYKQQVVPILHGSTGLQIPVTSSANNTLEQEFPVRIAASPAMEVEALA